MHTCIGGRSIVNRLVYAFMDSMLEEEPDCGGFNFEHRQFHNVGFLLALFGIKFDSPFINILLTT